MDDKLSSTYPLELTTDRIFCDGDVVVVEDRLYRCKLIKMKSGQRIYRLFPEMDLSEMFCLGA